MLTITAETMRAFEDDLHRSLIVKARNRYIDCFAALDGGDGLAAKRFEAASQRALARDCTTDWSLWTFVLLERKLGEGFDARPPYARFFDRPGSGHDHLRSLTSLGSGVW